MPIPHRSDLLRQRTRLRVAIERQQRPCEARADHRLQTKVVARACDRKALLEQRGGGEQVTLVDFGRAEIAERGAFGYASPDSRAASSPSRSSVAAPAASPAPLSRLREIDEDRSLAAPVAGFTRETQRTLEMLARMREVAAFVFDGCVRNQKVDPRERLIAVGQLAIARRDGGRGVEIAAMKRDGRQVPQRRHEQFAIVAFARGGRDARCIFLARRFVTAGGLRDRESESRPGEARIVIETDFEIFSRRCGRRAIARRGRARTLRRGTGSRCRWCGCPATA